MFRFFAKSAVATWVWKRYRRSIVSTLALFISYFLIAMIHSDYVDYATSANDKTFLWASYLLKWAALIGITLLYYLYNTRALQQPTRTRPTPEPKKYRGRTTTKTAPSAENAADPFADIRRKKNLKSRGDIHLEK